MIEQFTALDERIELVEGIDQKGEVHEAEARSQVRRCHGADRHALHGAHLEHVHHLNFAPQNRKGLEVEIDPAVGAAPEFVADDEPGKGATHDRMADIGDDAFVFGAFRVEGRFPLIQGRLLLGIGCGPQYKDQKKATHHN